MSLETLRKLFSITIPFYDEVRFIWHGGEPAAMGMEFYRAAMALQKEINTSGAVIGNSMQSNLTLLDEPFIDLLLENGFRIGSSFDGTNNEATRHNTARILAGRDRVVARGGRVGFICVVQRHNIDRLAEDYRWFKAQGLNYTLNPYLTAPPYEQDTLFVPAEEYVEKMCAFFDDWMTDTACNIRIAYFEDFIDHILFGKKSLCCFNSCLGKHIGVRHDGRIFNCNRDFPAEYSFGNVWDYDDIHQCFASSGFDALVKAAVERRYHCKETCDLYEFCAGGCNSTALTGGDLRRSNDYSCRILRGVYTHIARRLQDCSGENCNPVLAKKLAQAQEKCDCTVETEPQS